MRAWREEDLEPFAALNADAAVMEFMPKRLTRDESEAMVERIDAHFAERGFGLWALEVPGVAPFVGCTGLQAPRFEAHFTPCVEVGWRIAREHWGRGYAPEAAREALRYGFEVAGLEKIVSFTSVGNTRSRRVMEKIGMRRDPADDFDHPGLPEGHPLRRHVLYLNRRPAPR
ncbi:MAG: GNAT family N-acetyltransferase [Myxococcota bacterium]